MKLRQTINFKHYYHYLLYNETYYYSKMIFKNFLEIKEESVDRIESSRFPRSIYSRATSVSVSLRARR